MSEFYEVMIELLVMTRKGGPPRITFLASMVLLANLVSIIRYDYFLFPNHLPGFHRHTCAETLPCVVHQPF